jgi:geranylgeranyl reductase family protein
MTAVPRDADVIVVGAGPAGTATAILLAEQGLRIIVLDRARFPRPKICGEYLSPEAGRVLDRLGVLKTIDTTAVPLKGMRIIAPDGTVLVGTYRQIGDRHPYREHGMAIRREVLDTILVERMRALPVDFRERSRVTDLVIEGSQVVGVEAQDPGGHRHSLGASVVIGADGRTSVVAQRLDCRRPHRLRRMALVTYVRGLADCGDRGEIYVDPPDYAILNPVGPDRVNLSLVVPLQHAARFSDRLEQFFVARVRHLPHLARRLAGAERVAPVRGLGPLAYRAVPPRHGGVLLVGDAAGFYDPFTGEGMFTALHTAELAAAAVVHALKQGDVSARALVAFDRARRAASRDKARVTRALQAVISRRWLANMTAHALARRPALLDTVMGVIGDFVPPRSLLPALFG